MRLCGLYIGDASLTWISNALERTSRQQAILFLSIPMRLNTADAEPPNSWWRLRRCLAYARDWPENSAGPYSLTLSLSLLLAIGLIVKIGH
jgi:hypothetical protein